MKKFITLIIASSIWLASSLTTFADDNETSSPVELIDLMSNMQRFTHKLYLSEQAKNLPLIKFYTHELEEAVVAMDLISNYAGYPVSNMARSILRPTFQQLENAVKEGDFKKIDRTLNEVIKSCNSCHDITEHGYIVIEVNASNPYMQNFKPR